MLATPRKAWTSGSVSTSACTKVGQRAPRTGSSCTPKSIRTRLRPIEGNERSRRGRARPGSLSLSVQPGSASRRAGWSLVGSSHPDRQAVPQGAAFSVAPTKKPGTDRASSFASPGEGRRCSEDVHGAEQGEEHHQQVYRQGEHAGAETADQGVHGVNGVAQNSDASVGALFSPD